MRITMEMIDELEVLDEIDGGAMLGHQLERWSALDTMRTTETLRALVRERDTAKASEAKLAAQADRLSRRLADLDASGRGRAN